ncbi:MAG: bifunctional glutamate N-acetyltransferase/amino-acid acetyltransferase ArgJ [Candidatus Omnitrophica bacterium]|nr:bifunctional glutamate N-acetyltransferase/amino-acid acetyltransferase ArgJ [Candidatus Omnitrophota bacterium]MDD5429571.1 bifunctional glutamate N-acetyltransferase/amino-acid acetyltransferase ArgJ [Candidatus Omnitrophota bacterium]
MKIPEGFLFSAVNCGIKNKKPDLGLIYCSNSCQGLGVFTSNVNPSYSVTLSRQNINNPIKAILVNSGNANCYSHSRGLKDTGDIVSELAKRIGTVSENILIASTGIIGKKLPKEKIIKSLSKLIKGLSKNSDGFSQSILTTDTFSKKLSTSLELSSGKGSICGFAKGAGMICPNMATMLGFILTDFYLPRGAYKKIIDRAVEESFNSISIDGCMSTNDTVFFISSKKVLLKNKKDTDLFSLKLKEVCLGLAQMIVKDAEGATKFIEIEIKGAGSCLEAKKAGMYLANSNLFKCALYGANANWGRIISALGHAGIRVKENVGIKFSPLKKNKIFISIDLKRGKSSWKVYTSDLTPEYVKINAEYS